MATRSGRPLAGGQFSRASFGAAETCISAGAEWLVPIQNKTWEVVSAWEGALATKTAPSQTHDRPSSDGAGSGCGSEECRAWHRGQHAARLALVRDWACADLTAHSYGQSSKAAIVRTTTKGRMQFPSETTSSLALDSLSGNGDCFPSQRQTPTSEQKSSRLRPISCPPCPGWRLRGRPPSVLLSPPASRGHRRVAPCRFCRGT